MPVCTRSRSVRMEKSYAFAQVKAWMMLPISTGSAMIQVPRRRTGPFSRANSSPASASSANGSR